MKNSTTSSKLSLRKETLRTLGSKQLGRIAAGEVGSLIKILRTYCALSASCGGDDGDTGSGGIRG